MDRAIKVLAWCAAIMAGGFIALVESWIWQSEWSLLLILILPMLAFAIVTLMGTQSKALAWYSAVMACISIAAWVGYMLLMFSIFTEGGPPGPGEVFLTVALPSILILPVLGLAVLILIRKRRGV